MAATVDKGIVSPGSGGVAGGEVRCFVVASKPLASLISIGSVKGRPRNWTANGIPSEAKNPPGTTIVGRPV
jgi:hypothetical protein